MDKFRIEGEEYQLRTLRGGDVLAWEEYLHGLADPAPAGWLTRGRALVVSRALCGPDGRPLGWTADDVLDKLPFTDIVEMATGLISGARVMVPGGLVDVAEKNSESTQEGGESSGTA